jgi:hypothetical protein
VELCFRGGISGFNLRSDLTGQRHVLYRLSSSEARRTLEVRLAPAGNETAQLNYLRSVAEEWGDKARTGHLPRPAAWLNLTTSVLKTLQYPLPATTFTEKECTAIMAPILAAGLPTSGICRNFPRALVYGSLKKSRPRTSNMVLGKGRVWSADCNIYQQSFLSFLGVTCYVCTVFSFYLGTPLRLFLAANVLVLQNDNDTSMINSINK